MYTPGEIRQLCDMAQPQIGVMTIIGSVHMERAGSLEAIVAGKQELVEELFNLRFQFAIGQIKDPNQLTRLKRDIARMKTILNERRVASF